MIGRTAGDQEMAEKEHAGRTAAISYVRSCLSPVDVVQVKVNVLAVSLTTPEIGLPPDSVTMDAVRPERVSRSLEGDTVTESVAQ